MVSSSKGLCLLLCILSFYSGISSSANVSNCRKCKAGFYVKQMCINDNDSFHDTICAPCPAGRFMSVVDNLERDCKMCSGCTSGFYTVSKCTATRDMQCATCDLISDTESFKVSCQNKNISVSNINILDENLKLDNIAEPGSGSDSNGLVDLPQNVSTINEYLTTSDNETEGSGEVILTIPSESEIVLGDKTTRSTTSISQIATEVKEEDLIIITASSSSQKSTITTSKSRTSYYPTTNVPTKTQPTITEKMIDIGDGFKLTNVDDDDNDAKYGSIDVEVSVQPLNNNEPKKSIGDNKTPKPYQVSKRKSAMTDDSDKVSIGIVVAVGIIAALVFFAIGFIVSKYCRRRRQQFKMMNKMKNGGTHNGSVPVIVDVSVNTYKAAPSIYDEIEKEPNGTCSSEKLDKIIPEHTENVYAIPDKKRKRESVGIDIKYIDETDDEVENKEEAKLIENDVMKEPKTNGHTTHSAEEPVEDSVNESSPMLNEIQTEMERNSENVKETDALVENS